MRFRYGFDAGSGLDHTESGRLQILGVHLASILVVIDDENERLG